MNITRERIAVAAMQSIIADPCELPLEELPCHDCGGKGATDKIVVVTQYNTVEVDGVELSFKEGSEVAKMFGIGSIAGLRDIGFLKNGKPMPCCKCKGSGKYEATCARSVAIKAVRYADELIAELERTKV